MRLVRYNRGKHKKMQRLAGNSPRAANQKGGIMGILAWIVFGLLAGVVAKFIMPGKDPGGFIVTILIGIAGAVIGGFLATLIGFGSVSGFDLRSFIIAVLGALLLLFIFNRVRR